MAAKLCWRMDNAVDAKWAEVLKKKYQYRPDISKGAKSRIWAAVRTGQNGLLEATVPCAFGMINGLVWALSDL